MPREHVWGDTVTVHRGDLPVLAARTTRDLTAVAALDLPALTGESRGNTRRELRLLGERDRAHADLDRLQLEHTVLRRRHQLLSQFADDVADLTGEDLVSSAALRQRLTRLRTALAPLELGDPDVAAYGPSLPLDEAAELVLLREFAQDVGQVNAAADFPAIARSRLTPLVTQLAQALLDLRERPEPVDDAAPLTADAERAEDDARRTDPVTTGPGWRTPHPDCPRRDYVHAGHRDLLPNDAIVDCPGFGPTFDAVRDYAAGHGPDPALDAPNPTPGPDDLVPTERELVSRLAATADPAPADDLVELQLALVLTWIRDGGHVTLGIVGHDHATGTEHDVGGFHLTLDWGGANRLIKKTRVARDQSHGAPE